LEGEHPSGASLDVGRAGDYDHLMVGWPVVVNHNEQVYRMYYGTFDAPRQVKKTTDGPRDCGSCVFVFAGRITHTPWASLFSFFLYILF
jgi:hypothetical protein